MSRFSITLALLSSLVLGAGACSSTLEPTGSPITQQDGVGLGNPSGDDNGGLTGGQGVDDPAGDDREDLPVVRERTTLPATITAVRVTGGGGRSGQSPVT